MVSYLLPYVATCLCVPWMPLALTRESDEREESVVHGERGSRWETVAIHPIVHHCCHVCLLEPWSSPVDIAQNPRDHELDVSASPMPCPCQTVACLSTPAYKAPLP